MTHSFQPSQLGHGNQQCIHCGATDLELAAMRRLNFCEHAPAQASSTGPLNLTRLRLANMARQEEWPGAEAADLCFRGLEFAGEAGELANKVKKLVRLQRGIKGTTEERETLLFDLMEELADVVICVDLIAMQLDLDLSQAIRGKFNTTSHKHGLKTRL